MFVLFLTPDVDCNARNISERHKITYVRSVEKGKLTKKQKNYNQNMIIRIFLKNM